MWAIFNLESLNLCSLWISPLASFFLIKKKKRKTITFPEVGKIKAFLLLHLQLALQKKSYLILLKSRAKLPAEGKVWSLKNRWANFHCKLHPIFIVFVGFGTYSGYWFIFFSNQPLLSHSIKWQTKIKQRLCWTICAQIEAELNSFIIFLCTLLCQ